MAQTLSAAPVAASEVSPAAISPELTQKLSARFGGQALAQIEQECRTLIQNTAMAMLELGLRLLFLKETVKHGEWLPTLERIGICPRYSAKIMQATIRFSCLDGASRIVDAAHGKTKLLELLSLDDDELTALAHGKAVRGISLETLPGMTVAHVRSAMKCVNVDAFGTAPVPPSGAPVLGEAKGASTHLLQEGDRIKTLSAGRTGKVVKVYGDGSACICWDDGEPQPYGLGHERVPASLIAVVDSCANRAAPHDFESLPALYDLSPGEFEGMEITLVKHAGKAWMIAQEVAAALGDTLDEASFIEGLIDDDFERLYEPGVERLYSKGRFASTGLVVRLLDGMGVASLNSRLGNGKAEELGQYLEQQGCPEPAKLPPIPLIQCVEVLEHQWDSMNTEIFQALNVVRCIRTVADARDDLMEKPDLGCMAEIAEGIMKRYADTFDDMEQVIGNLRSGISMTMGAAARGNGV